MTKPRIISLSPDVPVQMGGLAKPYSVLLDSRDAEWLNEDRARRTISALFATGCRYFVCFGPASEALHDLVDEVLEREPEGLDTPTSFHVDESIEEVFGFYRLVALNGMEAGLLYARHAQKWRVEFF